MEFTQNDLNNTIELINKTNMQYMSYVDSYSHLWSQDEIDIAYKMIANMTMIIKDLKDKQVTEENFQELFVLTETYNLIYGELSKIIVPLLIEE